MMFRTALAVVAIAGTLVGGAAAHDYTVGSLKIVHPWARATPKGASVGGGYLKITNTGSTPDRLVSGATDASNRFEVHEMSMDNGVMKMRQLAKGLEIAPDQTVELKPGGFHVMFMGLKAPFEQGKPVKATLQFEKAGKVDVEFKVEGIGAQTSSDVPMQPGGGMQHGH